MLGALLVLIVGGIVGYVLYAMYSGVSVGAVISGAGGSISAYIIAVYTRITAIFEGVLNGSIKEMGYILLTAGMVVFVCILVWNYVVTAGKTMVR